MAAEQSQQTNQQPRQTGVLAAAGVLPERNERCLLVGKTRFGKSTLALALLQELREGDPQFELLVVDTKPHFRASRELTGISTGLRYRSWQSGDAFPSSVVLPASDTSVSLDYAFSLAHGVADSETTHRGAVVVLQTDKRSDYPQIAKRITEQYRRSNRHRHVYLYFDEAYSLLKRNPLTADAVSLCITAGGERGVGVMTSSQRPAWIGADLLSENTRFYCFRCDRKEDRDNLKDNGLPTGFRFPRHRFVFRYYNTLTDDERLLRYHLNSGDDARGDEEE